MSAERRRELFARRVIPHMELLVRAATSPTQQPADAEDVVQDTLLRAYRAIEGFDGAYPRASLLTIPRNANSNRSRRRETVFLGDLQATSVAEAGRAAAVGPEDVVTDGVIDPGACQPPSWLCHGAISKPFA